ncbi:Outer membrane receptor proteins, mostly Fe transport [Lutibacter agarilyticus]|uniref:Outer membrane receptor proteins, mostly Fe transport n=2 Tax=Lutibacter agarilyticus TaxID=1109740 RepID=A0A238VMD8_9FLAO|nr:Outer membrane receptor proteins, mostly Fe transport [Lutibacter agarilyticus]
MYANYQELYMKKLTLIISCLLIASQSFAQLPNAKTTGRVTIKGTVIDFDTKEPLEYATVVVKPLNGDPITGDITNSKGHFNIEITPGNYDISIEFISFKPYELKNVAIVKSLNLGVIELAINAEALDEVEIVAEKSTVEIRLDKKIYNVGKDMTVKGGTASDVLDNVPSVTVDVDGTVSLRGSENVRILINGKPSSMVGLSGTDALRQLPADAIEKVEVITSPSARYEAEGTGGILNIVLRKGKAQGFNASVTATAGIPDNLGGSVNLNYRIKKFNFFTNTAYSYTNSPGNSYNNATYFNEFDEISSYRNEKTDYDRSGGRFNTRLGLEYFLTDKSSLTGTFYYRESDRNNISTNYTSEFDASKLLTRKSIRINDKDDVNKNIEYSLNYTHDFNDSGHNLSFDFQYNNDDENEFTFITDYDTYPSFLERNPERTTTVESDSEFTLKGDYVLPIGENAQFEAGFNLNLNEIDSDFLVQDYDPDSGDFINNPDFTNSLVFEQNIYAFYTQYGSKINKFSYLLGLRSETTDRSIQLLGDNTDNQKTWTELFPTVNVGIEFSETESLTVGYNRRLRRPRHFYLNPFETRTSETTIRKGNINLDPTYTGSFDIGYLKRWSKFTLNSSVYYSHSTNNIEWIQTEETRDVNGLPTIVIVRSPVNLSTQDRYGFEFTANYNPFKWWKLSQSFNFFRATTEGDYEGVNYDADNISWFTRFNSTVTLPGEIDWQTRAMYMGPSQNAQTKRLGIVSINLAFSKDLLKEKATISFNVSDLLNSRKRISETTTETTFSEGEFQYRQRQFLLNFTYRFNQKKKRERSQGNDGDGGEEMF